ncbi:hypothetical protein [Halomonas ventosae]|uniref:Uncharacterized protein n=1 Tax=Halomonas ventosae TaxID=229007 RepID=A0A4R6HDM4_9GAMM|nr:hypothetical protein [Halomonas ventosae]TDO06723.1 hypothetical protein DFO68_11071 [Halomonas ventosae]
MLERMGNIAVTHVGSPFHFTIPSSEKTSHPLLVLDRSRLGYSADKAMKKVEGELNSA